MSGTGTANMLQYLDPGTDFVFLSGRHTSNPVHEMGGFFKVGVPFHEEKFWGVMGK